MSLPRASGVLLHPTSLPDSPGIGDLGDAAFEWIDFLARAGQTYWQVLPLGPTGYGDSPYQCFSAFAGNPLLISPTELVRSGLLPQSALEETPRFGTGRVPYGDVIPWKRRLLELSYQHFKAHAQPDSRTSFERFCQEEAEWLEDFTLFMALKDAHGGAPWWEWERDLRVRVPSALEGARVRLADEMGFHRYQQWLFFEQWRRLKAHAEVRGVKIIGDIPIFVAADSADAWSNAHLFQFDEDARPIAVAGVPPDYFSATGQLWGNPLYRWDVMREEGYRWWIRRFQATLRLVDIVRVDHFRGFEAYWAVPAGETTAVNGRWVKGPGADFFNAMRHALGELPIIAEDLGFITPEVTALREQFGLPGMKVLQFAFSTDGFDPYLPHNYPRNCVVYTGTHDNDTTVGWFTRSSTAEERAFALRYLRSDGHDIAWDMIHLAWTSVADTAIAPLQDFLRLGSEARMNLPGSFGGNWQWRCPPGALTDELAEAMRELTDMSARREAARTGKSSVHMMPSAEGGEDNV
ncbi:MAG: 4-alpha-glucanotransferase [Anaerolineae bacterium]